MSDNSIENQEIKGINLKVILIIVCAVVSSTVTIIMTINSLRTEIQKIQSVQDKQSELNELKIRTLDIRVTNMEGEQKEQNSRIQRNEERLNGVIK